MSLLDGALAALRGRRRDVPAEPIPDADDDRALVRAIIDGSQSAFAQLVQAHQRTCAHVIGRMVGDRDQVADLLQETASCTGSALNLRCVPGFRGWPTPLRCSTCDGDAWKRNGW